MCARAVFRLFSKGRWARAVLCDCCSGLVAQEFPKLLVLLLLGLQRLLRVRKVIFQLGDLVRQVGDPRLQLDEQAVAITLVVDAAVLATATLVRAAVVPRAAAVHLSHSLPEPPPVSILVMTLGSDALL